jgi:flagellar capping protein FliD
MHVSGLDSLRTSLLPGGTPLGRGGASADAAVRGLGAGLRVEETRLRRDALRVLGDVASAARALDPKEAGSALRGRVVSSDATVVDGRAAPAAAPARLAFDVVVSRVATAQANASRPVDDAATAPLAAGTYGVRLSQGGVDTVVSFRVDAGDASATVLERMAAALNGATTQGVRAAVTKDAATGSSRLVVTGRETGVAGAFTLSDAAGRAVATTGVGQAVVAAADAAYTVDGVARTAGSNDVTLAEGVDVTLRRASTAHVRVTVEPDGAAVAEAAETLAGAHAEALRFFAGPGSRWPRLAAALRGAADERRDALRWIGVAVGPDGALAVDRAALDRTARDAPARARAALGGLAAALHEGAGGTLATPGGLGAPEPEGPAGYRRAHGALGTEPRARGFLVDTRV